MRHRRHWAWEALGIGAVALNVENKMMELVFTKAKDADLQGILSLQQANLKQHLSPEEVASQGFVTVVHDMDLIKRLNDQENHIIARDGDKVVGYTLAMTREAKKDIPVLVSLFDQLETIPLGNEMLADYQYIVVGQVCVDKDYRGQQVLDRCYAAYRDAYEKKYALAVTDIVSTNLRSRKAHQRIGFRELKLFTDEAGTEWVIVVWDWR
ncbi:MAG: GNAT family N-acetyltransferase [Chitinophagaceae bacterium]